MYKNLLASILIFLAMYISVQNKINSAEEKNFAQMLANLSEETIPEWVFGNSSAKDKYYDIMTGQKKLLVYASVDCPTSRTRSEIIEKAVKDSGASKIFDVKIDLLPEGTEAKSNCHKIFDAVEYPSEEFDDIVFDRQGDREKPVFQDVGAGRYCIPFLQEGEIEVSENACKCVEDYIFSNCGENVCLINPMEKKLIKVNIHQRLLTTKLKDLKKGWN